MPLEVLGALLDLLLPATGSNTKSAEILASATLLPAFLCLLIEIF